MGNQIRLSELDWNDDEAVVRAALDTSRWGPQEPIQWKYLRDAHPAVRWFEREHHLEAQFRAANERAERAEKERDIYKSANTCNAATVDLLASQKIELKAEISHLRAEADKAKWTAVPDAEGAD